MDLLDSCVIGSLILTLGASVGCTRDNPAYDGVGGEETQASESKGEETSGEAGDGDGDPQTSTTTGDGDGDPQTSSTTGDGDGDPDPVGDGDGDDPDPVGDGDGDPDPGGDGDGDTGDPDPVDMCADALDEATCSNMPGCKPVVYEVYWPDFEGFCYDGHVYDACIPAQECESPNNDQWFWCNEQLEQWIGVEECFPAFIDAFEPCPPPPPQVPECP